MRYLISLLLATGLFASGNFSWVENGVAVRQGVHIEWQRTGDSGAEGEMIMAWSDTRTGDRDIYIQKIDTLGTKLWGETGRRATVADGRQEDPVLVSDGLGGAFLAWIDYRSDEYGDVYAQHIDADGNLSWDPAGVPVAVNTGSQQTANMARGATGVAYLIWDDGSLSESGDIFGTVLQLDGPLAAGGSDGLPLVIATGSQTGHSIETSGSEAVVVWLDNRDVNDPDIYGQRLDVNFTGLWGENGIPVCGDPAEQSYPKVAPADGNRVVVSWLDKRNHIKTDIFTQLLDEAGNPVWTADGLALTDLPSEQRACRVKSNGVDRIYYVWEDFRNNAQDPDIYLHSFDLSGNSVWTPAGIPVVQEDLKQLQPRFATGDEGGIYVTWLDERNGGFPESDIYLQYVTPDGDMVYPTNGLALTSGYKYQTGGLVRPDGNGGAMVLWSNASTGSIGITGQHITLSGTQTWDADGLELFFGIDGDANNFKALSWGEHSGMIFWEDKRWSGTGAVAMAQVMDRSAAIQYSMDGIVVSGNEEQRNPDIVVDDQGGAYLSYTNISTGTEILFAQHIDGTLTPTWPAEGLQVNPNALFGQLNPRMVSSSDGYLYYFWTEEIFLQGLSLFGQKYDIAGNAQWAVGGLQFSTAGIDGDKYAVEALALPDGEVMLIWEAETVDGILSFVSSVQSTGNFAWTHPLTSAGGGQMHALAIYDANSDLVHVAWEDQRNLALSGVDLYLVAVNAAGDMGEESLISDAFGDQTNLVMALADDGSGTLYAAWQNFDGFQHDIFVRNLTTAAPAEQITNLESDEKRPALRSVTASRYLVAWEDSRPGIYTDVYMYDSEVGSPGHAENGIAVSMAVLNQMQPQIVPFADHSTADMDYLIVWQDMRSSGKTELTNIYAQAYTGVFTVSTDGPVLASDLRLESAFPNPFNGAVTIPFINPVAEELSLRIYDLTGREILQTELGSPVSGSYIWNGSDLSGQALSSGVYLVSISSDARRFTQKLMYLK